MTLDFEDWTDGELLSLFVSGCITELVEEAYNLGHSDGYHAGREDEYMLHDGVIDD